MLKPSTRQLIKSFGYRRQYMTKAIQIRWHVMRNMRMDRRILGSEQHRQLELGMFPLRQHLATLHTV